MIYPRVLLPDDQAAAYEAKAADLRDLVAQCDPSVPPTAEDQLWLDAPAVGP